MYLMTSFYYGAMSGLAVLWREEKSDLNDTSLSSSHSMNLRAVSTLSTLGLYQDLPDLITSPYSNTSITRQHIGYTTHKLTEFFENLTEDATQKALLKSKSFLLHCSEISEKMFDNNLFTTEEIAQEEGVYDRFFPDKTSFCTPINEIGAPPKLNEVEYRLSIMQSGGVIVDSYLLPKGEKILDSTILYLTVSDKIPGQAPPPPPIDSNIKMPIIGKKRVFVAACTGIDDKHGEDSQGEGRLLFFSLDYAMYQEDDEFQVESTTTSGGNTQSEIEMKDGSDAPAPTSMPQPIVHDRGISAAQKKFYGSIKPKLRLLWSGPGPGTVVTQFKEEYVLCTVGSSIYIYQLNQETMELEQIAFIFAQVMLLPLLPSFLPPSLPPSLPPLSSSPSLTWPLSVVSSPWVSFTSRL
jgi:hypothetical protein